MKKYDELEFVHRISMNNMIKTSDGFRGSCPICGEGNSPWKRRCNILYYFLPNFHSFNKYDSKSIRGITL